MWRWALVVVLASCEDAREVADAEPLVVLDIDVLVTQNSIRVFARERDRPCTCSDGEFPEQQGTCVRWSDLIECDCDPPPAACAPRVHVERDPNDLVEGSWSERPESGGYVAITTVELTPTATLALDGCGGTARIPVGGLPMPAAEITGVAQSGEVDVLVTWTTDPPDTPVLLHAGSLFGSICHVASASQYLVMQVGPARQIMTYVPAIAGPVVHATPIGVARVWSGIADGRFGLHP